MSTLSLYQSNIFNQSNRNFMGSLDVDRVKANPLYKCKIINEDNYKTIQGVYNSDAPFSVSASSNYEDQFEFPFQDQINKIMAGGNWIRNMQGKSQFIFKSLRMSEQRWTGSESPSFPIRIDIPIIRASDAPWHTIRDCLEATCGTRNEKGLGGQVQKTETGFQIFAPNGYRVEYSTSATGRDVPKGTYTIQLGEGKDKCWFRMPNAIITSMNASIGSKKYYDGNPTFVSIDISFRFWRYALYEDVTTWFPKLDMARALTNGGAVLR